MTFTGINVADIWQKEVFTFEVESAQEFPDEDSHPSVAFCTGHVRIFVILKLSLF